jgi:hypothetical protein
MVSALRQMHDLIDQWMIRWIVSRNILPVSTGIGDRRLGMSNRYGRVSACIRWLSRIGSTMPRIGKVPAIGEVQDLVEQMTTPLMSRIARMGFARRDGGIDAHRRVIRCGHWIGRLGMIRRTIRCGQVIDRRQQIGMSHARIGAVTIG